MSDYLFVSTKKLTKKLTSLGFDDENVEQICSAVHSIGWDEAKFIE